jgi:hypothetical protein
MRRFSPMFAVLLLVSAIACTKGSDDQTIFQATLSGGNEVPARGTSAAGAVGVNVEGQTVHYTIETNAITSVTGAHIHSGAAGVNGPIRISLYPGPGVNFATTATGSINGILIEGSFTANQVSGVTFEELLAQMQAGTAYANVHTSTFPGGEIRGQMRLVQ